MSGKPLTLLYETLRERVRQSLMGETTADASQMRRRFANKSAEPPNALPPLGEAPLPLGEDRADLLRIKLSFL